MAANRIRGVLGTQPEPPPKAPCLMLATVKELKVVMQCGVAVVMNHKEEAYMVQSLTLPDDWVPLDAESNLIARGVEESIERKAKGVKKSKSLTRSDSKKDDGGGGVKPTDDDKAGGVLHPAGKPDAAKLKAKPKKK